MYQWGAFSKSLVVFKKNDALMFWRFFHFYNNTYNNVYERGKNITTEWIYMLTYFSDPWDSIVALFTRLVPYRGDNVWGYFCLDWFLTHFFSDHVNLIWSHWGRRIPICYVIWETNSAIWHTYRTLLLVILFLYDMAYRSIII